MKYFNNKEGTIVIKTPHLSVDGIIKLYNEENVFLGIILIERLNKPHGIALPGGFVDVGESIEFALVREMKEETNLDIKIEKLLNVYSDPKRDARFHTASVVYICTANGKPKALDDAKNIFIYKHDDIPFKKLVFDHEKIIRDYLESV